MLGNGDLTAVSKQQAETAPGMAHFAGTGPVGKTCGQCVFKGYSHDHGKNGGRSNGCRKAYELLGKKAKTPDISPKLKACKYFDQSAVAQALNRWG
jgi:hypothetical protein